MNERVWREAREGLGARPTRRTRTRLANWTAYPRVWVEELVDWTAGTLEAEWIDRKDPATVELKTARLERFSGNGARIAVCRIPSPDRVKFVRQSKTSFAANSGYIGWKVYDWKELVVALVAHEVMHVEQYRRLRSKGKTFRDMLATTRENEADRQALLSLRLYREGGREKVAALVAARELEEVERRAAAAALKARLSTPEARVEKVRGLLPRWERRSKLAATKLSILRGKARRYSRIKLAGPVSQLQIDRAEMVRIAIVRWERKAAIAKRRIAKIGRRVRGLERSAAVSAPIPVATPTPPPFVGPGFNLSCLSPATKSGS